MRDDALFTIGESFPRAEFYRRLRGAVRSRRFAMTNEFDGARYFHRSDPVTGHWLNVMPSGDAVARVGDDRFVRRAGEGWHRVVADMDPDLESLVTTAEYLGPEPAETPADVEPLDPDDYEPVDRQQLFMPTTVTSITRRRGLPVYLITSDGLIGDDHVSNVDIVTMDGLVLESTFRYNGAEPPSSHAVLLEWDTPQDDAVRAALASDAPIDPPAV